MQSHPERYLHGWGGGGGEVDGFFSENKTSQKIFQNLVSDNGGLKILFQTFFDLNFSENSLIFNTFRNSSIPGALALGKLGPLF